MAPILKRGCLVSVKRELPGFKNAFIRLTSRRVSVNIILANMNNARPVTAR